MKTYKIDSSNEKDSRYKLLDRISEDDTTYIESQNRLDILLTENDIYHEVTPEESYRMDLISYNYYGSPLYWWAIALASNIYDPLSVRTGDILRIPPISTVFSGTNTFIKEKGNKSSI